MSGGTGSCTMQGSVWLLSRSKVLVPGTSRLHTSVALTMSSVQDYKDLRKIVSGDIIVKCKIFVNCLRFEWLTELRQVAWGTTFVVYLSTKRRVTTSKVFKGSYTYQSIRLTLYCRLCLMMYRLFKNELSGPDNIILKYTDDEGDLISMTGAILGQEYYFLWY